MKQKKTLLSLIIAVIILILGILRPWHFHEAPVPTNSIIGTVTSVINRPDHSKDGSFSIDIKSSSGQKYTVNATAHIHSPISPDTPGEECVGISSDIKVGDKVEFNLPKAQNQANLFDTCYTQGLTGYYFDLN